MPVIGDVCRKGPIKILVKRSSTYRKFSVSLMIPGREREWRTYFWILLLIGREGNCVTECCEEWVSTLKEKRGGVLGRT